MSRYCFITDNIRNSNTTTRFNNSEYFLYQLLLITIMNQIKNTIGNNQINRVIGN